MNSLFEALKKRLKRSEEENEIIYKSFLSLFFRVISYILGFLFVYIIAQKYALEAQGVFAIVFTLASLLTLISKLGIQTSMIKWLSVYFVDNEFQKARFFFLKTYKLVIVISFLLGVLLFVFARDIAISFFNKENLANPIKIISACIPFFASTEIIAGYFQSQKKIAIYSFYNYASKFLVPLFILIGIIIFNSSLDSDLPVLAFSSGIIVIGVIAIIHLYLELPKPSFDVKDEVSYKELLKTSFPMLLSSSLVMLMWWSDTFILGVFKSEAEVGVYSIAVKLATLISFVYSAVISILMPKIAHYYKTNKKTELQKVINYSSKLIFVATIPLVIVLILFPELVLSIFGEEYREGYLILYLLVIAQLTNSLTGPVGPFLSMSGDERNQLKFVFLALLLNFVVSFILVGQYGGEGVALGSAIGMIVWNLIGAIYIKLKHGIQTWIKI